MTEPVNEADLLDQQAELMAEESDVDPEDAATGDLDPGEADPVDVREQQRSVPLPED